MKMSSGGAGSEKKKVLFASNMLIHLIFYTLFHLTTNNKQPTTRTEKLEKEI